MEINLGFWTGQLALILKSHLQNNFLNCRFDFTGTKTNIWKGWEGREPFLWPYPGPPPENPHRIMVYLKRKGEHPAAPTFVRMTRCKYKYLLGSEEATFSTEWKFKGINFPAAGIFIFFSSPAKQILLRACLPEQAERSLFDEDVSLTSFWIFYKGNLL